MTLNKKVYLKGMIASFDQSETLYNDIKNELKIHSKIDVDLKDLLGITTSCAKQIFGKTYLDLGSEEFSKRVIISNTNKDFKIIIQEGIISAINTEY